MDPKVAPSMGSRTPGENRPALEAALRRIEERLERLEQAIEPLSEVTTAAPALEEFVSLREARDKSLEAPRLLFPSVQFHINGGRLPAPGFTGIRYFKLPANTPKPTDGIGNPAD